MTDVYFTAGEIETLGKVVNSLGIMGSQILLRHRPELYLQAHANLRKCRKDSEATARQQGDSTTLIAANPLGMCGTAAAAADPAAQFRESICRMVDGAAAVLLASAFLGHCIASYSQPRSETVVRLQDKRLN